MSWSRWLATPAPQLAVAPFRFDHEGVFAFAAQPNARPAEAMPPFEASLPWFAPDDILPAPAAPRTAPEPSMQPARPSPVATAEPAPQPVAETIVPPVVLDQSAPAMPASSEAPPQQSEEELALFAQFAGLYDDFSGDEALAGLLGSDWAEQNQWQGAGGAPLG